MRSILEQASRKGLDPLSFFRTGAELSPAERNRLNKCSIEAATAAIERGASLIEYPSYPAIQDPDAHPPALFCWGDASLVGSPSIGIVGTRGATAYGRAVATKFAEVFASAGLTVVSGGAIGIDTAAHKGAIAAGGATMVVLPCGIDKVSPAANTGLFQSIRETYGCLVSQFACGSSREYHAVVRNATIAALSLGVVIVEAPEQSGALTTAHAALEQNKPVFVVPANIDNAGFRGSHALIRDGATLVDHPDQVLLALGYKAVYRDRRGESEASPIRKAILKVMTSSGLEADRIGELAGLEPSEVLAELTMLELEGRVIRDGIGYAIKP